MNFVFLLIATVVTLAVVGGALAASRKKGTTSGKPVSPTTAAFSRVPADQPPRYFEMVDDTYEEPPEIEYESAMNRGGKFYVEGETIPRIGDGAELLADADAAAEIDPSGETTRVYDDTTDGDLAKYQDARLQRSRQLQAHSHSVERYHMTRQMVERELRQSEQNGSWWEAPHN